MIVGFTIVTIIGSALLAGSIYFYISEIKTNKRLSAIIDRQRARIYELEGSGWNSNE